MQLRYTNGRLLPSASARASAALTIAGAIVCTGFCQVRISSSRKWSDNFGVPGARIRASLLSRDDTRHRRYANHGRSRERCVRDRSGVDADASGARGGDRAGSDGTPFTGGVLLMASQRSGAVAVEPQRADADAGRQLRV